MNINKADIIQAAYSAGFECDNIDNEYGNIDNEYQLAKDFLINKHLYEN